MTTFEAKSNQLINEKSPYLLQHAYNPVDWYPWNENTFKLAKDQNKPIFLSIGYSTCYWCHVMEREVFEDEEIAALMNDYFINIKVDREERPDVDRIYMLALQAMTGAGGWPMSMFLTPDLKPFYGATYIPPKEKYGRAGFEDVISEIHKVWENKRDEVINSSEQIYDLLNKKLSQPGPEEKLPFDEYIFDKCFETCERVFDVEHGGFGTGNKFPRPVILNFLLQYHYFTGKNEALDMVTYTLHKMYMGGLFDHLAGGFHRYSVDELWRVPHFEKMLYDQAQLASTYLDAYMVTKKEIYLSIAEKTLEYVLNYMTDKEGGFYSAEDAESAISEDELDIKEEGAYYLWTQDEINDALGSENGVIMNNYFGTQPNGNTINDPHEVFGNKNVLFISKDLHDMGKLFNKTPEELVDIIKNSKEELLTAREQRPKPHLDDKILTSWNALMISAFAKAYRLTGNQKYLSAAENSLAFILKYLYNDGTGEIFHRYRDGEAKYAGSLEDYAFIIQALIDMYEVTFNTDYLPTAVKLNKYTIDNFYDKENGGFFDIPGDSKDIILKTKESYDGAEPSGNSIQILNLLKLAIVIDDSSLRDIADKSLNFFYTDLERMPFSSPQLLFALYDDMKGSAEIVLSGEKDSQEFKNLQNIINSTYIPNRILLYADSPVENVAPFIKTIVENASGTNVFICENYKCDLPVKDEQQLRDALANLKSKFSNNIKVSEE